MPKQPYMALVLRKLLISKEHAIAIFHFISSTQSTDSRDTELTVQIPLSAALPPLMQLKNLKNWATPAGTPKTTPRKNPSPPFVLQRSISEPYGSGGATSSTAALRYSPDTSVVPEETDDSTKSPLSLSDAARKCAIQVCAMTFKD